MKRPGAYIEKEMVADKKLKGAEEASEEPPAASSGAEAGAGEKPKDQIVHCSSFIFHLVLCSIEI